MHNITERHQIILEKLHQRERVNVLELSKQLQVSAVTIRKDLKILEDKGLLFRSHGGAFLTNPYINERPVNEKEQIHAEEKRKIAKKAVQFIQNDNAIIIASGTTVLAFARQIRPNDQLTTITSSLNVALELIKHKEIEVLQLGGSVRKSSFSTVGPYGSEMLAHFSCNKFFLGIDGLDLDFGLTTTSSQESHLNKKMISSAQKTIVLTDSSKFGRRGFSKICDLKHIDQIITDKGIPEKYLAACTEMGIEVTLV